MKKALKCVGLAFMAAVVVGVAWLWLPYAEARYNPSGLAPYLPEANDSFESYIEENRRRIRTALERYYYQENPQPFGPGYDIDQVLDMRSPYQLQPDADRCNDRDATSFGFLMVHGLSDSPYLLTEVATSMQQQYPCALIRGLLSPGHGTVPGDLRAISTRDWLATFEYGVESFRSQVDSLYVVGYSNGTPLALVYLNDNRDDDFIAGLIALSPGVKPLNERSYLSPYMKYVYRWVNKDADTDAVKYESFPMNAAAQFYLLTRSLMSDDFQPLTTPVMMVVSGDDTTVNNQVTADFFCSKLGSDTRRMIWYQSGDDGRLPEPSCFGIEIVNSAESLSEPRFISYSHVGITMPMDNPHYGLQGYAVCVGYSENSDLYARCQEDDAGTVYAEKNYRGEDGLYQGKLVRRSTFNPAYSSMIEAIGCFVDGSC